MADRSTAIGVVGTIVTLLAVLVGFFGSGAIGIGPCGGDGGSHYAEEGSPRIDLCRSAERKLELVEFPGVPLLVAVGTAVATARRRWTALIVGLGLGLLAFAVPLATLLHASPDCQVDDYHFKTCPRTPPSVP
ncbi:hypothetical protein [Baekduia sp. Peel2402]|uniref:hypothetical protein n=1 Tax=Baekduia sp. Peel2402 TaxID=3458296 RepID=UPI00403EE491